MVDAIDGSIIMTPDIVESINATYDFRVPRKFQYDPTGAEISWLTPSLGGWIKGLLDRHHQLSNWIFRDRPASFWLTGFFNPQGFLTAMKQEVTRLKKGWSLDEVEYRSFPQRDVIQGDDGRIEGKSITPPQEGVFIHGLFLEGAGWSKAEKRLVDSTPKELFCPFPILHVTAISTAIDKDKPGGIGGGNKALQELEGLKKTHYYAPVYKYPARNDRYLIFRCHLQAEGSGGGQKGGGQNAIWNWTLCGAALLCQKD